MDDEEKMPTPVVKLLESDRIPPGEKGPYKVIGLSQTIKYSIGQWLTKDEVQGILNDGTYKVTVK